jgi:hypothetical protein
MWFDKKIKLPGATSAHHLWVQSVRGWVSFAESLGFRLDPSMASLRSNVFTVVSTMAEERVEAGSSDVA